MQRSTFKFDFQELSLDVGLIERVIGYKDGESHETISDLISEVLKEAGEISTIRAEYAIFPNVRYNDNDRSVVINDQVFNVRKIVYGQIRKSDSIALFLCTAGAEIGSRSKNAMKGGDLLKGYIYDVVGSGIAEAAADLMQNSLELRMFSEGKRITNRYSPGYCDWDVSEQHKLFGLIPGNFCGIRLTPSALMDPVKSVSGFIGIGVNVRKHPYTCHLCDMKDCLYRRVKV